MSEVLNFYIDLVERKLKVLRRYVEKLSNIYTVPLKDVYFEDEDLLLEELLDAIVYKFNKIQSLISEKLFKMVLEYVGIDARDKNFVEVLGVLEKEGILEVKKWKKLREIRNKITHDYPDEIEDIVDGVNELIKSIDYLEEMFLRLKSYKEKFDAA